MIIAKERELVSTQQKNGARGHSKREGICWHRKREGARGHSKREREGYRKREELVSKDNENEFIRTAKER